MAEEVEKVYCCQTPSSDSSLNPMLSALLTNQNHNDPMAMAMMSNGGMNNQWNNPFIYLVWMMFAQRMWNNGENGSNNDVLARVNELGNQMNTNQNTSLMMDAINGNHEALHSLQNSLGVDFATLNGAISGVQNAITQVGGQIGISGERVINSVLLGNKDLTQALQTCCCENKQLITNMGYQTQLGQKDLQYTIGTRIDQLANGIQTGFAQIGFNQQTNTNAIIQANQNQTQTILNALNNHWTESLRDQLFKASQDAQTASIVAQLKTTTTTTTA